MKTLPRKGCFVRRFWCVRRSMAAAGLCSVGLQVFGPITRDRRFARDLY
jgi:hypothetical protein